jgi:YHS domain-containing protein
MTLSFLRLISCTLLLVSYSLTALAVEPIYTRGSSNVAIKGYDTVAYFTESKPVKGNKAFSTEYKGAVWYFASQENLQRFLVEPERYAPQFGGYCAYAVSRNTTASIKPEIFNIHGGKLYLNYNASVQRRWLKDLEKGISNANKNWPDLLER